MVDHDSPDWFAMSEKSCDNAMICVIDNSLVA